MSMPYYYEEPEIYRSEPHNVKFKPKHIMHFSENNTNRYAIEKPECEICGATEETKICNRTFWS